MRCLFVNAPPPVHLDLCSASEGASPSADVDHVDDEEDQVGAMAEAHHKDITAAPQGASPSLLTTKHMSGDALQQHARLDSAMGASPCQGMEAVSRARSRSRSCSRRAGGLEVASAETERSTSTACISGASPTMLQAKEDPVGDALLEHARGDAVGGLPCRGKEQASSKSPAASTSTLKKTSGAHRLGHGGDENPIPCDDPLAAGRAAAAARREGASPSALSGLEAAPWRRLGASLCLGAEDDADGDVSADLPADVVEDLLVAMSTAASSAEVPSGAIPDLKVEEGASPCAAGLGASPCEVGEGASPCAGEEAVLTEVKHEILVEESPRKQPRATSPGRTALTPPTREDAKSEHTSSASGGHGQRLVKSQRGRPKHSDENKKFCAGCRRQCGVSPCHVDRTAIVEWAAGGGRGCWCKDCYNLYRTWFSASHSLTCFKDWLDADPKNRKEFQEIWQRYISLRVQGSSSSRIT